MKLERGPSRMVLRLRSVRVLFIPISRRASFVLRLSPYDDMMTYKNELAIKGSW